MKIVIPMAGRGSRFQKDAEKNPEYKVPKPLIKVKRKPMVAWALESLPFVDLPGRSAKTKLKVSSEDLVFICLQEHEDKHSISKVLKKHFGKKINIVLIPEVTQGAAETVYKAKKYIDPQEDLIISDSDHYFDGTKLYEAINKKGALTAGIIPVFKPPDKEPKWSYTLFDKNYIAIAVAEKDSALAEKNAYANIGAYYFSKGKFFLDEVKIMIKKNEMYGQINKQEFFVAPIYQRLISKGLNIQAIVIPKVWGLGTPKDLDFFLRHFK